MNEPNRDDTPKRTPFEEEVIAQFIETEQTDDYTVVHKIGRHGSKGEK